MWNSNNLNDHFNASGNLELLALYIAEDHFNDNNTIIIGDVVMQCLILIVMKLKRCLIILNLC